jgi:hypothetical protein
MRREESREETGGAHGERKTDRGVIWCIKCIVGYVIF